MVSFRFDEIWNYIEKTDTCWIYKGLHFKSTEAKQKIIRVIDEFGKRWVLHRYIFLQTYGHAPRERTYQLCKTYRCVAPHHRGDRHEGLIAGTVKANMFGPTNAKINMSSAKKIRRCRSKGRLRSVEIAKLFNISVGHVNKVLRNKVWIS